ncbi:hypothetical protein QZH41_018841 [Actinostola sp. cb2023]|nr:hypothetical protein QZH41_018841 [Actinostola sp. cb2023]
MRTSIQLNPHALRDPEWWTSTPPARLNGHPIQLHPFDATIWTDASKLWWGAKYREVSTVGHWSTEEAEAHINILELRALYNTTAVAYMNKRGDSFLGPHFPSTRTMISGAGEKDLADSPAHSKDRELRGGYSIHANRSPHGMDPEQTSLQSNLSDCTGRRTKYSCTYPFNHPSATRSGSLYITEGTISSKRPFRGNYFNLVVIIGRPHWTWAQWCDIWGICPISAPVTDVLPFLTSLILQGNLEYRTIALTIALTIVSYISDSSSGGNHPTGRSPYDIKVHERSL